MVTRSAPRLYSSMHLRLSQWPGMQQVLNRYLHPRAQPVAWHAVGAQRVDQRLLPGPVERGGCWKVRE